MADKASTTRQMDSNGRVTIPKSVRRALELEGKSADIVIDIEVLNRHGETDE